MLSRHNSVYSLPFIHEYYCCGGGEGGLTCSSVMLTREQTFHCLKVCTSYHTHTQKVDS